MKITRLHIENFRSIKSVDIALDETTVFIGPNNSGKTAILEAVRIALSRRWGQQGTGFTENDVHCATEGIDPRTAPPVRVSMVLDEPEVEAWPADLVADLDKIMTVMPNGLNRIAFAVLYPWNPDTKNFEPGWEFLDSAGNLLPLQRRAIKLSRFRRQTAPLCC
jgi:putative ATP-dependent endonuclease of OLD family